MAPRGRLARLGALAAALLAGTAPPAVLADVATDGTLGRKVRLSGKEVEVGADLGRVRGKNLFHSFERFGVEPGGRVTFTGPSGLDNVVSRVTGGEASRIDGTLASRVPGADVYLVNPAGVVFGPGARLDVPGSFHASTADELRFSDGVAFNASDPSRGGLSVARPEAFGFLGGRSRPIRVDETVLEASKGEMLSLTGGDITIRLGEVRAAGGRITLVALGGAGAVDVVRGRVTGTAFGTIHLTNQAQASSSGAGGGSIWMHAGHVVVENTSLIEANNDAAIDARGGILIEAGEIELLADSQVISNALAEGNAGGIRIDAGRLLISGLGSADTGTASDAGLKSSGKAGMLMVTADRVELRNGSFIASNTRGRGDANSVMLIADELEVRDGSFLTSSTFANGNAGLVMVRAKNIIIDGDPLFGITGVFSDAEEGSSGNAGTVRIIADKLEIRDEGTVTTLALGLGDAGTVMVTAKEVKIQKSGIIASNTEGPGDAVNIIINSDYLEVKGEATDDFTGISSSSIEDSLGSAGSITIQSKRLFILGSKGFIGSSGLGEGPAGDVTLHTDTLVVEEGSIDTFGTGARGGRITAEASDLITLIDAGVTSNGIQPEAGSSLITLRAPLITLLDGSRVVSLTGEGTPIRGSGEAQLLGNLTFISEDSEVLGSSTVELAGIDNNIGSGLQLSPGAFLDAGALLGQICAARRGGEASTFARAGRKGGLPPAPDRPLWSAGDAKERGRAASAEGRRMLVAGAALSAGCDSQPLAGAM